MTRTILEAGGFPKQPRNFAVGETPIGQSWALKRTGATLVTNAEQFDQLILEACEPNPGPQHTNKLRA